MIAVEICHEKQTKAKNARHLQIDDAEMGKAEVELCWEQSPSVMQCHGGETVKYHAR